MALEYYRLTNLSNSEKLFGYQSGSTSPGDFYTVNLNGYADEQIVQSFIEPIFIQIGVSEAQFTLDTFGPPPGFAWLWNDGNKVKYIKINHLSFNNFNITPYISDSLITSFAMIGARDSSNTFMYNPSGSQHVEDYYLSNSTKKGDYSFLVIEQPPSSRAVSDLTSGQRNFNFEASGEYTWYATSSGQIDNPTPSSGYSSSIAQGYFPKNIEDFGTSQLIRGWNDANYYVEGNLVPTSGVLIDHLKHFNTGSTERDYDFNFPYTASSIPWFINAPTSSVHLLSSSFGIYSGQNRSIKIGPSFRNTSDETPYGTSVYGDPNFEYGGSGADDFISYYYKEDTNQILVYDPSNIIDEPKNPQPLYYPTPKYNSLLVGVGDPQTYITDEGHEILVKNGQQLSVFRGQQEVGIEDVNAWNYNRYLHRPYKIYLLAETGSNDNPSKITDAYVSFSSSLASERKDGVYEFGTFSQDDLGLTASINLTASNALPLPPSNYGEADYGEDKYGGNGFTPANQTWQTASLNLFLASPNDSLGTILASSSLYIDDINTDNFISLRTIISSSYVQPGASLRLVVSVNTGSIDFKDTVNSSLIVNNYSMSIVGPTPEFPSEVPTYLDNILQVPEDCNPFEGSALNSSLNTKVMDVDYSTNALIPVNLNQIKDNTAKKAEVVDSFYTSPSSITLRYDGSKSTSDQYNVHNEEDEGTYGKLPTIDVNKAYSAYFNRIYDTYPLLNEKTSFEIKYIIDENGNASNPRIGKYTYFNLEGSLAEKEKANIAITDKTSEVLYYLNDNKPIFKTGLKAFPILYSQAASRAYTSSIFVTGKQPLNDDEVEFNDYSFRAYETIERARVINFGPERLSPENILTGSGINVTASYTSSEAMPGSGGITLLPKTDFLGINGAGNNKPLSDDYTYRVNYTFDTTKMFQSKTKNGKKWSFKGSKWTHDCGDFRLYIMQNNQKKQIVVDSMFCDVVHLNPNTSTGVEIKSFNTISSIGNLVTNESDNTLKIRMRGDQINQAMNNAGAGGVDVRDGGSVVKIRWRMKLQLSPNTSIKQGDKIETFVKGALHSSVEGRYQQFFFYQPDGFTTNRGKQTTTLRLEGTRSLPSTALSSSYWGFVGDDLKRIEMLSENGNQAYGREGFKQQYFTYSSGSYDSGSYNGYMSEDYDAGDGGDIEAEGVRTSIGWRNYFQKNPSFAGGKEPSFLGFPPIVDDWEIQVGDEIRFENNEDKVHKIIQIDPPDTQTPVNGERIGRLKISLSKEIAASTNLDFFLIRRFKEDKGNIIINFPKPYGVPIEPLSATGLMFPEFPVRELSTNPDEVLKNLLEQKLIE